MKKKYIIFLKKKKKKKKYINKIKTQKKFFFFLILYLFIIKLILADKYEPYSHNYNDCRCINPGSFSNSDYIFSVYYPSSKNSQDR